MQNWCPEWLFGRVMLRHNRIGTGWNSGYVQHVSKMSRMLFENLKRCVQRDSKVSGMRGKEKHCCPQNTQKGTK